MKGIRELAKETNNNKNAAFASVLSTKVGRSLNKKVVKAKKETEKKKSQKDLEMERLLQRNFSS